MHWQNPFEKKRGKDKQGGSKRRTIYFDFAINVNSGRLQTPLEGSKQPCHDLLF